MFSRTIVEVLGFLVGLVSFMSVTFPSRGPRRPGAVGARGVGLEGVPGSSQAGSRSA